MAVKTLTIREDVYNELIKIKEDDESFSELFERLTKCSRPDIMKFAGALSGADSERISQRMKKFREGFGNNFRERRARIAESQKKK